MDLLSWSKWVNDRFFRTKIIESEDILPEYGTDGCQLHVKNEIDAESGGDTYEGYFKQTNTTDSETPENQKVTIAAGYYQLNLESGAVAEEELTMSQTSVDEYIYLQGDDSSGTLIVTLESSTVHPVDEAKIFRGLICTVEFSDNTISNIIRQHCGVMRGGIFEECA